MMDAPNIESLYNLTPAAVISEFKGGKIRMDALKETAIGLGTRAGMNSRTLEIKKTVDAKAVHFDRIYNFRSLLISKPAGDSKTTQYAVLPPVISEVNYLMNAVSDTELRASDRVFKIEKQAKFVTAPPTWNQYLDQQITKIETPDASLLPKDDVEKKAWKEWIATGWELGVKQADAIFESNLNRLARDYQGMVRYRVLLNQNMVSMPYLAERRDGVVGNENEMSIDERTLRITAMPGLNLSYDAWTPAPSGKLKEPAIDNTLRESEAEASTLVRRNIRWGQQF